MLATLRVEAIEVIQCSTFKLDNKKKNIMKIYLIFVLFTFTFETTKWITRYLVYTYKHYNFKNCLLNLGFINIVGF